MADPPPLSVLKKSPTNHFPRSFLGVCWVVFFENVCRFELPRRLQQRNALIHMREISIKLLKLFWAYAKAVLWTPRRAEAQTGRCLQQDSTKTPKYLRCKQGEFHQRKRKVVFLIMFASLRYSKLPFKNLLSCLKFTTDTLLN